MQRVIATLRTSLSTVSYADALAEETAAQRWSSTRPAFRDGVRAIEEHIARRG